MTEFSIRRMAAAAGIATLMAFPVAAIAADDQGMTLEQMQAKTAERFQRMDADKDGRVTRDERKAAWGDMRKGHDGMGRDGMGPGGYGPGRMGGHMMKEIDTNSDGMISRDEFMTGADRMFSRLDADGDGQITEAEREAMRARHMDGWKMDGKDGKPAAGAPKAGG